MEKVYYSDKEYEQMLRTLGEATERLHSLDDDNIKEMQGALCRMLADAIKLPVLEIHEGSKLVERN